jgi:UDP-glucose 4-epimerase
MKKILVTGGCGYIGSHTIVSLLEKGFEVVSVDSMERGMKYVPERVEKITGKKITHYHINMCNLRNLRAVFVDHRDLAGVIHFAAFKMVGESVEKPLKYYGNNLLSLLNLLLCLREFNTKSLIFSSSSSVYGNIKEMPVKEDTPVTEQVSPYGRTKHIGEMMITDMVRAHPFQALLLRYFNPAGAHESASLGEPIEETPLNLMPAITNTASGKQEKFIVNGTDYPTRDGSCIRDYVHVMDIADAHVLALEYLMKKSSSESYVDVINLGTGNGVTVLEMIHAFEEATGIKLNVDYAPRRGGDAVAVYADNTKAKELLGWEAKRSLKEMMLSAWKWEQANAKEVGTMK